MTIILNASPRTLSGATNIAELLKELSLEGKPVLIEHNKKALVASAFATTMLQEGDQVEVMILGAGG